MKYTDLPGAETALRFTALKADWPGELDEEINPTRFKTNEWKDGKFVETEPHFVSFMDCSDTFFWGSSDAEVITDENIQILVDTMNELAPIYQKYEAAWSIEARKLGGDALTAWISDWKEAHPNWEAEGLAWNKSDELKEAKKPADRLRRKMQGVEAALGDLFAARVRGIRPQGACYSRYPEELWPLFDAAGPERETGFGNPYRPGEYNR